MTSQKTIERCRTKVKELEEANVTLLNNNLIMAESNKKLRDEIFNLTAQNSIIDRERKECKQKCEIIIKEKDAKLQEKEKYLQSLHDTIWHLKNSFVCKHYNFTTSGEGFKFELEFHRKD